MPKETAKERVQLELAQLNEKISKLSLFLFSEQALSLTREMRYAMTDQLRSMQEYARCLLHRIEIWDKPERKENEKVCIEEY